MPVVRIELKRFSRMVGADQRRAVEGLPYLGLDIEGFDRNSVRVEYSPNRPDFGTDFGIAKALRGLLGREVGLAHYAVRPSGVTVSVDRSLSSIRPYIACATATGLTLDEEDVRQLISLQEDLHNGLGRRRAKAAIGLHDMKALTNQIEYKAVPHSFRFTPLDGKRQMNVSEVLSDTEQGKQYGKIVSRGRLFPMLTDSRGVVLSFPPVVNGNATKLTKKTKNVFIDVTGTHQRIVDDVLAILATTMADIGAKIGSVVVKQQKARRATPDLKVSEVPFDLTLVRDVTGLDLTRQQAVKCLERSRFGVRGNTVLVPRYRLDILHKVDISEEVALGYGIEKITPVYPPSNQPGVFNVFDQFLDKVSDIMAGSGMVELMTYELVDEDSLYGRFGRPSADRIAVESPKSLEHSLLRDSLLPSLMGVLGRNAKEDYPQRVFEIGRVYTRTEGSASEAWHLGCLIAHSQASYTEAKTHLESLTRLIAGGEAETREASHWAFAAGRSAVVRLGKAELGAVGEIKPEALEAFGVKVPVSGFELDLTMLHKQLK
ncbi:MAG: phenylalanine--tRNA ligase subunit beta [Nitrososphaerales archaeon]|nr:phenylalanine--tRNA ligase subunit beta [Nitrososphaerales archaeon]